MPIGLKMTRSAGMDAAYGACCEAAEVMNVSIGRGTLAAVRAFAADAVTHG